MIKCLVALALLLTTAALPSQSDAQEHSSSPERNAALRAAEMLEEDYVIPGTGRELASMLRSRAAEFDALGDPEAFAMAVTAAMQEIANDLHLRVFARGAEPGRRVARRRPEAEEGGEREVRFASPTIDSRMLSGEVGVLRLSFFYLNDADKQTLHEAMKAIEQAKVVILDLRDVPGGMEEAVMHLSGYFFAASTHLVNTQRRDKPVVERWSDSAVRGPRFVDEPVFILTSGGTGSAAESFVFGMKATDRATTVGEQTAGAGHFGDLIDLGGGYEMFLPFGRTFNPRTGVGFEAEGIRADVPARAEEALHVALKAAGFPDLVAEVPSPEPGETPLTEYAGQYGPRRITVAAAQLHYQREGMPRSVPMKALGGDAFELIIPPEALVRGESGGKLPTLQFNRHPSGAIASLSIINPDGSVRETSPREEE